MAKSVINVSINKVTQDFLNRQEKFATILANRHLEKLAKKTEDEIKNTIKQSTKRPGATNNLADAFKAEKIDNLTYGVGKISDLNQKVPYWRHVNYGSLAIGAKWQHMVPTGTFQPGVARPTPEASQDGRWQVGKRASIGGQLYTFIPGKPIAPMNYIEKTLQKVLTNISNILKGF